MMEDIRNKTTSSGGSKPNDSSLQLATQMTIELVPIAVIIVLANLLVLVLFCLRKNLRTATNYFLIGLAIADLLTGAVNIPLLLAEFYNLKLELPISVPHCFTAILCAYHILVITGEKFFAIMKPLRHYQMTKKLSLSVTLLVWCISAFFAFIQLAWENTGTLRIAQTMYVIVSDVLVFVVPYTFMIYAYWTMFRAISRGKEKLLRDEHRSESFVGKLKQVRTERKCLIIFALMAAVYVICWLPWFVLTTLLQFQVEIGDTVIHVYLIVRYLTSAFNPVIYTFFKRDFKMALRSLIFRKSAKKQARETVLKYARDHSTKVTVHNRINETRTSLTASVTIDSMFACNLSPSPNEGNSLSPGTYMEVHPLRASNSSRHRPLSLTLEMQQFHPTNSLKAKKTYDSVRDEPSRKRISFSPNDARRKCCSECDPADVSVFVSSV